MHINVNITVMSLYKHLYCICIFGLYYVKNTISFQRNLDKLLIVYELFFILAVHLINCKEMAGAGWGYMAVRDYSDVITMYFTITKRNKR